MRTILPFSSFKFLDMFLTFPLSPSFLLRSFLLTPSIQHHYIQNSPYFHLIQGIFSFIRFSLIHSFTSSLSRWYSKDNNWTRIRNYAQYSKWILTQYTLNRKIKKWANISSFPSHNLYRWLILQMNTGNVQIALQYIISHWSNGMAFMLVWIDAFTWHEMIIQKWMRKKSTPRKWSKGEKQGTKCGAH